MSSKIYTETIELSRPCADCQGCPNCPEWIPPNPVVDTFNPNTAFLVEIDDPEPETFRYCMRAIHGIEARYDVRAMKQQVRLRYSNDWEDLTDGLSAIIRSQLAVVPFPLQNNNQEHHPAGSELSGKIGGKVEIARTWAVCTS